MTMTSTLRTILAAALALGAGAPLSAAELGAPSEQYLKDRAELEDLVNKRDLDLYELQAEAIALDYVILQDRLGVSRTYHYLAFRVRNQTTQDPAQLATRAKGYNEVLQAITAQYQSAKVATEGGVALRIDGVEGKDGVVLERQDAKVRTRTVQVTCTAWDEDGSRLRLLTEPARGDAVAAFQFADRGVSAEGLPLHRVREAVEERLGRKLLTPDELAQVKLPPFDGKTRVEVAELERKERDLHGWFVGEAYGVVVFDRLSDEGDRFTIQVGGLSNKFRTRGPEAEAGKMHDYFNTRTLRRTWQVVAERAGDEFARDEDRFRVVSSGFVWADSFQRLDQRRVRAEAAWHLGRIADDKFNLVESAKADAWSWYNAAREARAGNEKYAALLPDLEATVKKGK